MTEKCPVVILCGGAGTRLREETTVVPKPMVTIGGQPILWHLMKYYSQFGHREFILCLGYKSEVIKSYFLNYLYLSGSFSVDLGNGTKMNINSGVEDKWQVSCVDTGEKAMTGARLKRVEKFIRGRRFLLTYGDGLADVDIHKLIKFHESHGKMGTVTGIHPPSRFGSLHLLENKVVRFAEKPHTEHDYINGGFFVFEPEFLEYLENDDQCVLERRPLEKLAADGGLQAYLHDGFWQCMDTIRDRDYLEEQWSNGAPWKLW